MKTLLFLFLPMLSYAQNPYLDSLNREYVILTERKALTDDSIAAQKKEIEELWEKIRIGKEAEMKLKKTREEIEEMKRIMEKYQFQIDSLNRENMRLEEENRRPKKN
jgi:hypothetical protein